jgi:hypothetical protein
MLHPGMVELLWRVLPVAAWKSGLARHMEKCPVCAARLADKEAVRRVLVQAGDLGGLDYIWPAVRRALDRNTDPRTAALSARSGLKKAVTRPAPVLRWAAALGGAALAALILVGTLRYLGPVEPAARPGTDIAETDGFILHSARIENKPAETYIIHPQDNGLVVVWVEKTH